MTGDRDTTANLVEIFSSIQGEGPYVGTSTLFIRFGECDLRCHWCDSPHTWKIRDHCRFETARGSGDFEERRNPVSLDAILTATEALDAAQHRFISFTGGEPLLQPEAVAALARRLRGIGPSLYLETHGLAQAALRRVAGSIDVVSMDWKLASDVRRAGTARADSREDFALEHERFLATARENCEVLVKVVITPRSEDGEIEDACRRIAALDPGIPLILQPVTPVGPQKDRPSPARMHACHALADKHLDDVRVIPQTHPIYGVL